nr:PREDICTED: muscular LMNA-interacting protein isoform X7 [Lepisosteus oculatus]
MEREKQAVFFHGTGKSGHTVPTEVPPAKVLCFTFVPAVKKLPLKTRVAQRGRHEQSLEYLGVYKEKATEETMLEDGVFKAEVVYIGHSDEDEGGDNTEHHYLNVIQGDDSTKPGPQTQQYKIKSSYKALAAIPTNTLLLEQQAIDDRVEKLEVVPDNTGDERRTETHTEMCSPAQLRQESEELYAAIDQALEEPMPMRRTLSAPSSLQKLSDIDSPKQFTTLPRSAGRETKYAMSHLLPPACAPKQLTKPGVIRPVPVIPKVPEEEEEYHPNPFRQYLEEMTDLELQKHLSLPPSFLASIVSHPAFHHHLCQAGLLPGGLSLSAPLSLSHISCLIPGPYTHLSTPILPNLHTNLPRVSTLYNKPQHPIVTIHENEALSSKEITHTLLGAGRTGSNKSPGNQKLNKEKFQQNMQVPNTQELLHTAGKKEHKTQKSPSGPVGSTGTVSSSIDSAAAKTTEVRETHI